MADITKVYSFITEFAAGTHVAAFDGSDTDLIHFHLSPNLPSPSWTVLGDIGAIAYTNISESWPMDSQNAATDASGTITVAGQDAVATATATVPTFRYIWAVNNTAGDKLIGWWDNGSPVNLTMAGQVFTGNLDTDEIISAS